MSHECSECGREFDSERGLHIHQSQVHDSESEKEAGTSEKSEGKADSAEVKGKYTAENNPNTFNLQIGLKETALIFFMIGVGLGFVGGFLAPLGESPLKNTEQQLPIAEDTVDVSNTNETGEPVLGESDAPVTLVMYEDFQCPYCQRFEANAFQDIESDYVDSGDVRVVWKDFPIPQLGHNWAEPSAAAMECVYRQDNDAFWAIKDKVFQNQRTLTEEGIQSQIVSWAEEEGVSGSQVQSCIENGNPMDEVNQDKADGSNLDVTLNGDPFVAGTPSFVVYGDSEGTALSGALPYEAFQQVIEKELQDSQ